MPPSAVMRVDFSTDPVLTGYRVVLFRFVSVMRHKSNQVLYDNEFQLQLLQIWWESVYTFFCNTSTLGCPWSKPLTPSLTSNWKQLLKMCSRMFSLFVYKGFSKRKLRSATIMKWFSGLALLWVGAVMGFSHHSLFLYWSFLNVYSRVFLKV